MERPVRRGRSLAVLVAEGLGDRLWACDLLYDGSEDSLLAKGKDSAAREAGCFRATCRGRIGHTDSPRPRNHELFANKEVRTIAFRRTEIPADTAGTTGGDVANPYKGHL